MKYLIFFPLICLPLLLQAQTQPIKVVFDVTSQDESAHQSTMRHVKMMSEAYPQSQFEIVVYSKALPMVVKEQSSVAEDLEMLSNKKNVSVKICEASMKRHQVSNAQLIKGVGTVPDGILEIVTKQGEGWGYIKEVSN